MSYPVDCNITIIIKNSKIVAVFLRKFFHIAQKHAIELPNSCTHYVLIKLTEIAVLVLSTTMSR